jgi:putative tricarboxylic transport membrane protein
MTQLILRTAALCVGGVIAATAAVAPASAWEPKGQGECIAPSNPGGGWDMTCRTTSAVLQKLGIFKESIYVTNMPGGSGAVAIANIVTKRKGDTNLIVAASPALTFTIALGRTPQTYKDVIPIAQIGAEIGGFFVAADSKYKTLADIASALKADVKSISFAGGSSPGGQDHMKVAMFAKAIGVDPTKVVYVPFQGGGEALTSVLGGHTKVGALDISEATGQLEAGKIRGLAVLSDKRASKFPDIPTATEQGVKVNYTVWRGFYMAPGTPPDAVKWWTDALQKMVATPEWKTESDKVGMEPITMFGDEFMKFVNKDADDSRALLKELGFVK